MSNNIAHRIALVVGANESPNEPTLAPLTASEREATRLATLFMSPACGFTVLDDAPLTGSQATAPTIKQHICDALVRLGADDTFLVYFSGHGVPVTSKTSQRDVFLATYDFATTTAQTYLDHQSQPEQQDDTNLISMRWLRDHVLLNQTVGRIILILDCCYAGYISNLELSEWLDVSISTNHSFDSRIRVVITGSDPNRVAYTALNHTVFSEPLLDALAEDGAQRENGTVTLASLEDYLNTHVGKQQTVGFYGFRRDRDFVLATHKPKRQRELEQLVRHNESNTIFRDRLQDFVGRVDELAEIRQRIKDMRATGGYVTITGAAGEGKSSIIAQLVQEAGVEQTAFHFIAITPGREYQVSILHTLIARLMLKHALPTEYFPVGNYYALRDYFPNILQTLAERKIQETIYIDGLDQLEPDSTGVRDLSFLPTAPPDGIVIVLGTRPNDALKPLELLKPHNQYLLQPLTETDFHAMLKHLVARPLQHDQQHALYQALVTTVASLIALF